MLLENVLYVVMDNIYLVENAYPVIILYVELAKIAVLIVLYPVIVVVCLV